jgi:hypothetical protein
VRIRAFWKSPVNGEAAEFDSAEAKLLEYSITAKRPETKAKTVARDTRSMPEITYPAFKQGFLRLQLFSGRYIGTAFSTEFSVLGRPGHTHGTDNNHSRR